MKARIARFSASPGQWFAIVALAATVFERSAATAAAQCQLDPTRQGKIMLSLVQPYAGCETTPYVVGDAPACTPTPSIESPLYDIAQRGFCKVSLTPRDVDDCSTLLSSAGTPLGLPAGACHDTSVKAVCEGVVTTAGPPIDESEAGWSLHLDVRLTTNDGTAQTMDEVVVVNFGTPASGKMQARSSLAEWRTGVLGPENAALPPCTQVEVLDVRLIDPQDDTFAVIGLGTN